jgi:hypothetical protein
VAEEIVGLAPDVILVSTNSVVTATLKATRSIPIVFTWVSDPVGSGFVHNLPHPGGKVTGFHNFATGQVAQITYHLNRAMDNGLTREEAGEVLGHLASYAGWPNAFSAAPVVKEVIGKRRR